MSIKGTKNELYIGKKEANIVTFMGNKINILYSELELIEYCFASKEHDGCLNFVKKTGDDICFVFSGKANDSIQRTIEFLNENIPELETKKTQKFPRFKLSKCLLISFILGVLYVIYSLFYWTSIQGADDFASELGAGIAFSIVTPHLVCTAAAVIFNGVGLFLRNHWFALAGAILYTLALVLFPYYFMFVSIQMVLSYIGFIKIKNR